MGQLGRSPGVAPPDHSCKAAPLTQPPGRAESLPPFSRAMRRVGGAEEQIIWAEKQNIWPTAGRTADVGILRRSGPTRGLGQRPALPAVGEAPPPGYRRRSRLFSISSLLIAVRRACAMYLLLKGIYSPRNDPPSCGGSPSTPTTSGTSPRDGRISVR